MISLITAGQCRAARGFLGWSREELAASSRVAVRTVVDFERGARSPTTHTLTAIAAAFEQAGVRFTEHGVELPPRLDHDVRAFPA